MVSPHSACTTTARFMNLDGCTSWSFSHPLQPITCLRPLIWEVAATDGFSGDKIYGPDPGAANQPRKDLNKNCKITQGMWGGQPSHTTWSLQAEVFPLGLCILAEFLNSPVGTSLVIPCWELGRRFWRWVCLPAGIWDFALLGGSFCLLSATPTSL